jgi:hypothetical protein
MVAGADHALLPAHELKEPRLEDLSNSRINLIQITRKGQNALLGRAGMNGHRHFKQYGPQARLLFLRRGPVRERGASLLSRIVP